MIEKDINKIYNELERAKEEIIKWKRHSNCDNPEQISKVLDDFNKLVDELRSAREKIECDQKY